MMKVTRALLAIPRAILKSIPVVLAIVMPFLLCAFAEWQINPEFWGWYTRAVLAVLYAFYAYLVIDVTGSRSKADRKQWRQV